MSVVVHIKKLSNHKAIYIKRNKKLNHTTKHNTFKCYKVFPSHYQHFFIFVFLFIYFCFSLFLCFHIFITILLFNYLFSLSLDFQFLKIDILTLFGWNRFWNYIGCVHKGQVAWFVPNWCLSWFMSSQWPLTVVTFDSCLAGVPWLWSSEGSNQQNL